jgi:uncharacterized cupin superfamily protein
MTKKISLANTRIRRGSGYPAPFDEPCKERMRNVLGDAAGLTQFGVNLLRLPPGCWSSQRHWHTAEDEFIYVLAGELVLVTDAGEEILRAGDCAGFKAGDADGHHLQNRSSQEALVLEIGSRHPLQDDAYYPDIDLVHSGAASEFTHRDGQPYPAAPPKPETQK